MKLRAYAVFDKCTDISPEKLASHGIKLLLTDLDNTLENYKAWTPRSEITAWLEELKRAGIELFVVTNNRKERGLKYCQALGAPFIRLAGKPKPDSLLKAMQLSGATPEQTVMLGDQVFTDVLAGSRAGVKTLLVRPIDLKNPLRALRYAVEQPFIARSKRKGSTEFRR